MTPAAVLVLAAGDGTRMRSSTPKVLHRLLGRSLLGHVLAAAAAVAARETVVVVGAGAEQVRAHLAELAPQAVVEVQGERRGTADAAGVALRGVDSLADDADVLVLPGDAPLLRGQTLVDLLATHRARQASATLLTARPADPTGYGRVCRDAGGALLRVVEERDASPAERAIQEVATSVYAFRLGDLRATVGAVDTGNAAGEYYLTDVVALLRGAGRVVAAHLAGDASEALGVNDRVQLAVAARVLRDRIVREHQLAGAGILDPGSVWIDVGVELAADCEVGPGCVLRGATSVAASAVVGPYTVLTDTRVGPAARVVASTAEGALIGPHATVGPYSYLRPGTQVGPGAKVGAYVETKNAVIGAASKVPHLSYVGDATIGERSNIGAGTIFANFDGRTKHHTRVGDDVRIGSDTVLVPPVRIGDGAYTAGGSVITTDVPAGALGVGRARQRNVEGWVARRRGAPTWDPEAGTGPGEAAPRGARAADAAQTDGEAG